LSQGFERSFVERLPNRAIICRLKRYLSTISSFPLRHDRLKRNGEELPVTSVEFDLLSALLRDAGRVVKKEDLSENVLERRLSPYDRSLDMHI
jgi:DNA-binding response OmpR family regulator